MSLKTLSIAAIILAVVTAVGFGIGQPLAGLVALLCLISVGVYTLYRLSLDDGKGKRKKNSRSRGR